MTVTDGGVRVKVLFTTVSALGHLHPLMSFDRLPAPQQVLADLRRLAGGDGT
jgi:hypothetical protein